MQRLALGVQWKLPEAASTQKPGTQKDQTMTKRIAIAITTAVAFLLAGAAGQEASASTVPNGVVHTDGCPKPLVVHPDGTCWP
jgi:hypothetical protein